MKSIFLYRKLNIYMSRLKSGIQSLVKHWMLGFSLGVTEKIILLMLIIFIAQIGIFGCAPFRDVGDNVGETIGEVTDELGKEQKVGKGDDVLIIHPEADKKIKMPF